MGSFQSHHSNTQSENQQNLHRQHMQINQKKEMMKQMQQDSKRKTHITHTIKNNPTTKLLPHTSNLLPSQPTISNLHPSEAIFTQQQKGDQRIQQQQSVKKLQITPAQEENRNQRIQQSCDYRSTEQQIRWSTNINSQYHQDTSGFFISINEHGEMIITNAILIDSNIVVAQKQTIIDHTSKTHSNQPAYYKSITFYMKNCSLDRNTSGIAILDYKSYPQTQSKTKKGSNLVVIMLAQHIHRQKYATLGCDYNSEAQDQLVHISYRIRDNKRMEIVEETKSNAVFTDKGYIQLDGFSGGEGIGSGIWVKRNKEYVLIGLNEGMKQRKGNKYNMAKLIRKQDFDIIKQWTKELNIKHFKPKFSLFSFSQTQKFVKTSNNQGPIFKDKQDNKPLCQAGNMNDKSSPVFKKVSQSNHPKKIPEQNNKDDDPDGDPDKNDNKDDKNNREDKQRPKKPPSYKKLLQQDQQYKAFMQILRQIVSIHDRLQILKKLSKYQHHVKEIKPKMKTQIMKLDILEDEQTLQIFSEEIKKINGDTINKDIHIKTISKLSRELSQQISLETQSSLQKIDFSNIKLTQDEYLQRNVFIFMKLQKMQLQNMAFDLYKKISTSQQHSKVLQQLKRISQRGLQQIIQSVDHQWRQQPSQCQINVEYFNQSYKRSQIFQISQQFQFLEKQIYKNNVSIIEYLIKAGSKFKHIPKYKEHIPKYKATSGVQGKLYYFSLQKGKSDRFDNFIESELDCKGKVVSFIVDIINILKELNDRGLLHLDIHLRNIIYLKGHAFVIDFNRAFIIKPPSPNKFSHLNQAYNQFRHIIQLLLELDIDQHKKDQLQDLQKALKYITLQENNVPVFLKIKNLPDNNIEKKIDIYMLIIQSYMYDIHKKTGCQLIRVVIKDLTDLRRLTPQENKLLVQEVKNLQFQSGSYDTFLQRMNEIQEQIQQFN